MNIVKIIDSVRMKSLLRFVVETSGTTCFALMAWFTEIPARHSHGKKGRPRGRPLITRVTETGDPLRNRPKWRGGLGLDLHFSPTLKFKSQVTFVSSRLDFQIPTQTMRVGGYTKVDLALTYHPLPAWRGYVALENVTDASYEEFQGFPAPPLMFRLGIEYRS